MRIAFVVAGGVGREDPPRRVPHLVERLGVLAAAHDVAVVALRQEPAPARWSVGGACVWNVGRRPRRLRALAALARLHGERPLDVIHAFGLVPQGVVAAAASRLLRVPAVLEAPGGEFVSLPGVGYGGWRRAPGRFWLRLATASGRVVVPSARAAAQAERCGVTAERIPLEIDLEAWSRVGEPPGGPPWRIVWVGSLAPVKDPAFLVATVARLRALGLDVCADVVGEDWMGGRVHERARREGVEDHVTFHGRLSEGGVRARLDAAHVLLVTSRWESGPRALLEAAARGVPTVGPRVGILEEWAPDAVVDVAPWTEASVAHTLAALLPDRERRADVAAEARARLREHGLTQVTERWVELYREVTGT